MLCRIFAAFIIALVAGCATTKPSIPEGYTGPTAKIADTALAEDGTKAKIFYLAAIDGEQIDSSLMATRKASHGRGFAQTLVVVDRRVPAKPLRLKLVATHSTAAPIHEMASRMAGTFFQVDGEVEFTPAANGDYVITGNLRKDGSSVWIADARTLERVSDIIIEKKQPQADLSSLRTRRSAPHIPGNL